MRNLKNIDASDLRLFGLEVRNTESNYFCTPVGTTALYWTGVDGIHYGTIDCFGEMIFVICPMNEPGRYVFPVANNRTDFFRLLLACDDEAVLSQAPLWSEQQFHDFFAEYAPSKVRRAALEQLRQKYALEPMEAPYAYMKQLRDSFDYRKLQFSEDFEEWTPAEPRVPTPPPWSVSFHSDFFNAPKHLQPGTATALQKDFCWAGVHWFIPAVYACPEGLVIDLCGQFEDEDTAPLQFAADETVNRPDALNPFHPAHLHLRLRAQCNGQHLHPAESSTRLWVSGASSEDLESRWVLEHYELDPESAWRLERHCFRWSSIAPESLQELSLTFDAAPVHIPGKTFVVSSAGEKIRLTHPHSKKKYTLTVEEIVPEVLSHPFPEDGMEYPTCYTRMAYRMTPELPDGALIIRDVAPSDPARPKTPPKGRMFLPESRSSVAIGIIGGADGPTVMTFGVPTTVCGKLRMAASSLRFIPPERIAWQITFLETSHSPKTIVLIP